MNRKESEHEGVGPAVMKMVNGYWVSQCISSIAELKIPDLIPNEEGAMVSVKELAEKTNTKHEFLSRVLRALASVGFFHQNGDKFGLTEMSRCLRSDTPNSVRAMAVMAGQPFRYEPWGKLTQVMKTGESGMKLAFGEEMYDYFEKHDDEYCLFEEAMESSSMQIHKAILYAYDFAKELNQEKFKVVDIGGGRGAFLADILKQHNQATGILFDRKFVIQEAEKYLSKELGDYNDDSNQSRWSVEDGHFFDYIPNGADVYILKNVIHDWPEQDAITLLKCVASTLRHSGCGRLLIIEHVIQENNQFSFGKWLDVNMMVVTKGKDRTQSEYETLVAKAGLKVNRVIKTLAPRSIVECVLDE
eukprot:gb/GECH01010236.1/.p1 GENE.gb/GECH01010236.1/~~gb/GECH01010236.1/.p1  ORF type:complete len:359 (+),score=113.94 gb/GECH01010236.1/:1-1077(+)